MIRSFRGDRPVVSRSNTTNLVKARAMACHHVASQALNPQVWHGLVKHCGDAGQTLAGARHVQVCTCMWCTTAQAAKHVHGVGHTMRAVQQGRGMNAGPTHRHERARSSWSIPGQTCGWLGVWPVECCGSAGGPPLVKHRGCVQSGEASRGRLPEGERQGCQDGALQRHPGGFQLGGGCLVAAASRVPGCCSTCRGAPLLATCSSEASSEPTPTGCAAVH
jgi:hypothetical protein